MTVPLTGADGGLIIDFVRARPRRRAIAAAATAAVIVPLTVALSAGPASAATDSRGPMFYRGAMESPAVAHDTSPRFDHISPSRFGNGHVVRDEPQTPGVPGPAVPDTVTQTATATSSSVSAPTSFDGIGQGFVGPDGPFDVKYAPPDPNGDIGQDDYVEIVNSSIAVFDRSGTPLLGPVSTPTLFSNFGNCGTFDDGDGTVKYDKAANRWIVTEFMVSTTPYLECVAVSQTPDPLGKWYRYAFSYSKFPDYPKLGVWSDGYYATFNTFGASGKSFSGVLTCAYDRSAMLVGANASQQCFQHTSTQGAGMLPADIDGRTPPPAGAPNYQIQLWDTTHVNLWKFHVDWANSANSTLAGQLVTVSGYTTACSTGNPCIPQPGTDNLLDSLGDRAMYRLSYRNDNGIESLYFDHSVDTSVNGVSRVGIRWYQIVDPDGTPQVAQESTYSPDATYRWMGSTATDAVGDTAIGYSTSSSTTNPSIAVAVHLASDPSGQLSSEQTVFAGNGSQTTYVGSDGKTHTLDRWGDYTSMSVDPVDDCTFWYTNEYIPNDGAFNWATRIGHFKVSGCTARDVTAAPSPATFGTTALGGSAHQTITITNNGSASVTLGSVSLSGPNADEFSAGAPSTTSLPTQGSTATVAVTYTPTATGTALASLDVQTNARLADLSVALAGNGATVPDAPTIGTATAGNAQATVSFTAPSSDGGSAITGYTVTAHDATNAARGGQTVSGPASPLTVTGLTNGDTYTFTVTATNAIGTGPASATSNSVTPTAPAQAPGAPTGLTATASVGQVALSWTAPSSNGGSTISGYHVYRSTSAGSEGTIVGSTTGASSTSFTDTTVSAGTTYFYVVTAVNTAGEGPASSQVSATTPNVPGAPTNLSATPGDTTVSLTWTAPSNNGSAISGYDVYRSTTAGTKGSLIGTTPTTTSTSFTDTGRANGTTYYYEVTAINAVGESAPSTQVSATPATVPDPPTGLSATPGNQQVTLTWAAPAFNGGAGITGYNVYRSQTAGQQGVKLTTSPVAGMSYTDNGLTNGTTYFYEVTAVNTAGQSAPSTQTSATPATAPGTPTALSATRGDTTVTLSWSAPGSNGGSTITGYNVYRSLAAGQQGMLIGSTPTTTTTGYTDTGLANGTTYFYEVTAVNGAGEGAPSTQVSATPATAPDPPTNLTAARGNAQVALTWAAPSTDGGSTISGYKVYRSTTAGIQGSVIASPTTTSFTDTGLTNGTAYYYQVSAVNGAGEGAPSTQVSATPQAVPDAPTGLTAQPGNAQVALAWVAPTVSGGSVVTGYNVYRSTTPGARGTAVNTSPITATGYTDTGLTNGTTYYYEVTAVNALGEGNPSTQQSATPITVASAPNGLSASGGNQQVTLVWSAPSSNGGSPITGYDVYRSTTPGSQGSLVANPSGTTFSDTGLANGTTYYYQVAAVNGAGAGALTPQQPATPMTVPSAPLGLGATAGKSVVTLSWSPPATDGGSAVTGYTVYRSTTAGSRGTAIAAVGTTGYTDSNVSNGTTYYYEVTATNAAGEGPASGQVSARPHGAPSVRLTGQPSALTNSRTAVFSFATSDPNGEAVTTTCRLDGDAATTCSSGQTYTGLTDGAHTFVVSAADADGAGGTASYSWTVDATRPTVSLTSPRAPFTLATIGIRWSGSDGDGSGIASYDVRYRRASTTTRFGAWTSPASWLGRTSTSATRAESGGYTDCFEVRARDLAGNVSAWSRQRCTAVPLDDRALTASTGWTRTTGAAYFRHTATSTRRLGAVLLRRGLVADRVALVVTRCATCGSVRVYVRGRAIATVRLTAARLVRRAIIVLPRFTLTSGAVEIRVVSSGRVVQVDGVGVSRS